MLLQRPLYLASASPRRAALLRQIDLLFSILPPLHAEERPPLPGEDIAHWAQELAEEKALLAAPQLLPDTTAYILAADTAVLLPAEIARDNMPLWKTAPVHLLGKPEDSAQASRMMQALSGKEHLVISAFALLSLPEEKIFSSVSETRVKFHHLTDADIAEYVLTGEPLDKAGGYGIQSRGAVLVEQIIGDYYTVVGLPLAAIWQALQKAEEIV